jgi:hypothetical protein
MPIEIKELLIKVNVNPPPTGPTPTSTAPPAAPGGGGGGQGKDDIIAACVEQVLQILQQKNER